MQIENESASYGRLEDSDFEEFPQGKPLQMAINGRICKSSHLKAETRSYYIFKALDPALDLALSRIQT